MVELIAKPSGHFLPHRPILSGPTNGVQPKFFITLRIGDPVALVNGQSVTFDVPLELSGGRTLLS